MMMVKQFQFSPKNTCHCCYILLFYHICAAFSLIFFTFFVVFPFLEKQFNELNCRFMFIFDDSTIFFPLVFFLGEISVAKEKINYIFRISSLCSSAFSWQPLYSHSLMLILIATHKLLCWDCKQ